MDKEQDDKINQALSKEGTVTMDLHDYLFMRESLEDVVNTSKTHAEFIHHFRLSLAIIMDKLKDQGLDMTELYGYFTGLNFPVIENVEILKDEDNPHWIVSIKKTVDEKTDKPSSD